MSHGPQKFAGNGTRMALEKKLCFGPRWSLPRMALHRLTSGTDLARPEVLRLVDLMNEWGRNARRVLRSWPELGKKAPSQWSARDTSKKRRLDCGFDGFPSV